METEEREIIVRADGFEDDAVCVYVSLHMKLTDAKTRAKLKALVNTEVVNAIARCVNDSGMEWHVAGHAAVCE